MRVTTLPWAISIMAEGSTASEVFLNFTTQLYTYLCYHNPILT